MPRLDDPRIALATAALPEGAPDPAAFRYEPEYEAVAAEIGKLERTGPASVAWPEVVRDAQAILTTRSKDLSVATWLTLALLHTEGLRGLAVGLTIARASVEKFWEALFPKRARARIGAFEWLATRAARNLPLTAEGDAGPSAIAALAELEALDALLREKLPEPGVSFGELLRPLRALAAGARSTAKPKAEPEAPETAPSANVPPSPPLPPPAPASPQPSAIEHAPDVTDPERALSGLRETVRAFALRLMEVSPTEARAYRLLRAVTWLSITDLPPAANGRTELLPPPDIRRTEFEALRSAGNHKDLVLALERFCSGSGPFWLDGQRLVVTALGVLGPPYAASARAVVAGVGALLGRLPGLIELAFADGTPFADSATRAWVETAVLARPAQNEPAAGAAPWAIALDEAREKLANGERGAALARLTSGARAAPSGRARFLWELATARLCLEGDAVVVALPLLQHLSELIARHRLEEWEPPLSAEAASLLYRCAAAPELAHLVSEETRASIARSALARIARADPALAVATARAPHT